MKTLAEYLKEQEEIAEKATAKSSPFQMVIGTGRPEDYVFFKNARNEDLKKTRALRVAIEALEKYRFLPFTKPGVDVEMRDALVRIEAILLGEGEK